MLQMDIFLVVFARLAEVRAESGGAEVQLLSLLSSLEAWEEGKRDVFAHQFLNPILWGFGV